MTKPHLITLNSLIPSTAEYSICFLKSSIYVQQHLWENEICQMSQDRELQLCGFLKRTVFHNLFLFFISWHLAFWENNKGRKTFSQKYCTGPLFRGHISTLVCPQPKVKDPRLMTPWPWEQTPPLSPLIAALGPRINAGGHSSPQSPIFLLTWSLCLIMFTMIEASYFLCLDYECQSLLCGVSASFNYGEWIDIL